MSSVGVVWNVTGLCSILVRSGFQQVGSLKADYLVSAEKLRLSTVFALGQRDDLLMPYAIVRFTKFNLSMSFFINSIGIGEPAATPALHYHKQNVTSSNP